VWRGHQRRSSVLVPGKPTISTVGTVVACRDRLGPLDLLLIVERVDAALDIEMVGLGVVLAGKQGLDNNFFWTDEHFWPNRRTHTKRHRIGVQSAR
jgi:hypothetical protein